MGKPLEQPQKGVWSSCDRRPRFDVKIVFTMTFTEAATKPWKHFLSRREIFFIEPLKTGLIYSF